MSNLPFKQLELVEREPNAALKAAIDRSKFWRKICGKSCIMIDFSCYFVTVDHGGLFCLLLALTSQVSVVPLML